MTHGKSVVVPRDPTREMTMAGAGCLPSVDGVFGLAGALSANVWSAMLAAAPAPSSLAGGAFDHIHRLAVEFNPAMHDIDQVLSEINQIALAALSPEAPARSGRIVAGEFLPDSVQEAPAREGADDKIEAIRKLAMAAAKVAPGLWGSDVEKGEGEYGIGDETQNGFMVPYMENEHGKRLFDAHASDVAMVEEDYGFDEDGAHHHAWDENSRVIFEYLAAVQPAEILALIEASALTPRHEAPAEDQFFDWMEILRTDVIQEEYGYEEGEFDADPTDWHPLFAEGLSPSDAFRRALRHVHLKAGEVAPSEVSAEIEAITAGVRHETPAEGAGERECLAVAIDPSLAGTDFSGLFAEGSRIGKALAAADRVLALARRSSAPEARS